LSKEAGYDVHSEKGTGPVAKFDLYQDSRGYIYQLLKGGRGEPEGLNINIKEIMGL
jgi:hypothetical protein